MGLREVRAEAARHLAAGRYERAEVLLRQAVLLAPRDPQTWIRHAEVLKRLGRDAAAVSDYRLAARILDEAGHHPRAVAALKLAHALMPDDVDLIADLIRLEMRARRASDGVRTLFPLSSPSQLLGGAPESSPSGYFSPTGVPGHDEVDEEPRLALPMSSATAPAPDRGPHAEAAPDGASSLPAPASEPGLEGSSLPAWPQVRRLSASRIAVRAGPSSRWTVIESESPLTVRFEDDLPAAEDAPSPE